MVRLWYTKYTVGADRLFSMGDINVGLIDRIKKSVVINTCFHRFKPFPAATMICEKCGFDAETLPEDHPIRVARKESHDYVGKVWHKSHRRAELMTGLAGEVGKLVIKNVPRDIQVLATLRFGNLDALGHCVRDNISSWEDQLDFSSDSVYEEVLLLAMRAYGNY